MGCEIALIVVFINRALSPAFMVRVEAPRVCCFLFSRVPPVYFFAAVNLKQKSAQIRIAEASITK